jgi:hypothetical protein
MTLHLPDLLFSDQFFSDRLLLGPMAGELSLKWAVFADGLKQYWKFAADSRYHDSEEFLEEEKWVLAEDNTWPFSFSNLCETFGVKTESIRHALLAWKNAHRPSTVTTQHEKKSHRIVP